MNVNISLQSNFTSALFQNTQNQSVNAQSTQSSFTPVSASMASRDMDGDNDNESAENSSGQQQERASAGFNSQSIFSALNQNGSQGVSTDQLLNALTKQSSMLSSKNNVTQNNNLQNTLMDKILASYDTTKVLTQSSTVLSA